MTALGAIAAALMWAWVQGLPGYALFRWLVPAARGLELAAGALVCAFAVVPVSAFLIAMAVRLPVDAGLLWAASTTANLAFGAVVFQRRLPVPGLDRAQLMSLAGATLGCALLLVFGLRSLDGGDVFNTLQHCLYVIVAHTIANDASVALPLYDHQSGDFVHVLVHHTTELMNGLAPLFHEQRLGNAAILAPGVAFFGLAGCTTVSLHAYVTLALCTWLAGRAVGARPWVSALAAGVVVLSNHTILGYLVNENVFASALVASLVWMAVLPTRAIGHLALMGVISGLLIGVRETSGLFWPAVAVAMLWTPGVRRIQVALGAGLAMLCALPWLYVNLLMLGNPFAHPKLIDDSDGRIVANTLWSLTFKFKPLNWPFTDAVVRTAWNPFPTFLWIPLLIARSMGQLAVALIGLGVVTSRSTPRTLTVLALFALPHTLAIGWLEGLDWEQVSYIVPALAPLGVWMALGVEALLTRVARRWALAAGLLAVLVFGSRGLAHTQWPVDPRGLEPEHWPSAPPPDAGTRAVAQELTGLQLWPSLPVFRLAHAGQFASALSAILWSPSLPLEDGVPVYPSGRVAVLEGYAESAPRAYRFAVAGGPPRAPGDPLRTAVGLHTVTLRLPAERILVDVERFEGRWAAKITSVGPTDALRDFTFMLNPWRPAARSLTVTVDGGSPPELRQRTYGGTDADDERLFLVTNYPPEVLDVVSRAIAVDPGDEPAHCGYFLFVKGHAPDRIETLVLAGGHVMSWHGERTMEVAMPTSVVADRMVLFGEPYCGKHVPQYGDRYGSVPLNAGSVRLDRQWSWRD